MDINRIRILTTFLVMFILCSLLLPLSIQAASRGISVVTDLSHQSGKLGAYRALIIGINDYKDPKIPDLETAVNDARAMADLLQERYGFKVKLLLNRKATRRAIYKALRNMASTTKPTDSVLIYYAGHGDLDRTYNDGWWIPADAKGGDPVTYFDNVQVQKAMRSMEARHVLLISDACYSGTLFGQARAMPSVIDNKYYLNLYNEKSRWGMTSGNKTPVSDTGSGGHSVFAYQLLKELRKNEKPYISTQELYTRIAPIVGNNSEQTPICRPIRNTGDQGGEFVFVASSSAMTDIKVDTDKVDAGLAAERRQIEQERRELEKIKAEIEERKRLEAERHILEAERRQIEEEKQKIAKTELAAIDTKEKLSKEKYNLAIFKDRIIRQCVPYYHEVARNEIYKSLNQLLSINKKIELKYSYYDHSSFSDNVELIDNVFNKKDGNKIWIKESFFSRYEPNIKFVLTKGEEIGANLVFLVYAAGPQLNDNFGTVYLVDIINKKVYKDDFLLPAFPDCYSEHETLKAIKKTIDAFLNDQKTKGS